jgi:hypothetical protein
MQANTGDEAAQLCAELKQLRREFTRLFEADVNAVIFSERWLYPSPNPIPFRERVQITDGTLSGFINEATEWQGSLRGIELNPVALAHDAAHPLGDVFYDAAGNQIVTQDGTAVAFDRGWESYHYVSHEGAAAVRASQTIERANRVVSHRWRMLGPIVFGDLCLRMSISSRSCLWPDLLNQLPIASGLATVSPAEWKVRWKNYNFSLDYWENRKSRFRMPPIPDEATEAISDHPDYMFCERRSYIADSEAAIDWLLAKLDDFQEAANEPVPKAEPPAETIAGISQLSERHRLAYGASLYAEHLAGRALKYREAWELLDESGIELDEASQRQLTAAGYPHPGELDSYELPMRATFESYLTKARQQLGIPRKRPATMRVGRSIVPSSDL